MPTLLTLSGSPFPGSRTEGAARLVEDAALAASGARVRHLAVRDLPAGALIGADAGDAEVAAALAALAGADALLVASPVYKAAYTGVLKTLLDLAPADVLAGTPVAAVLSGGAAPHGPAAIAALATLLDALGADDVHPPVFLLDRVLQRGEAGAVAVTDAAGAAALAATGDWLGGRLGTARPV